MHYRLINAAMWLEPVFLAGLLLAAKFNLEKSVEFDITALP
jgi:hypothetical protein